MPVAGLPDVEELKYTPSAEHTKDTCELCSCEVWIGPKQKQKKHEDAVAAVMCFPCSIRVIKFLNSVESLNNLMFDASPSGNDSGSHKISRQETQPSDI